MTPTLQILHVNLSIIVELNDGSIFFVKLLREIEPTEDCITENEWKITATKHRK